MGQALDLSNKILSQTSIAVSSPRSSVAAVVSKCAAFSFALNLRPTRGVVVGLSETDEVIPKRLVSTDPARSLEFPDRCKKFFAQLGAKVGNNG